MVPVLVKSAIPINGAISVEPLNVIIFDVKSCFSKYFFVNVGNSVATTISDVKSSIEFILESSGDAKTNFVCPKDKSTNSLTLASLSLIKSTPVIPISTISSSTNFGISDARANITSISLLKVAEINFLLALSFNPNPAFSKMAIEGSLILPLEGTAIFNFILNLLILFM